jgi:subtilisin family serine protease
MRKFVVTLLVVMSALVAPVYAADYMVTVKDKAVAEEYSLEPVMPDEGVYLAEESVARELYQKGYITESAEDRPLYIPDDEIVYENEEQKTTGGLSAFANSYNDTYYSEELYFDQLGIKDYIDTYKPTGKVRIAVVDTGINKSHTDFANTTFEAGYNYVMSSNDTTDKYGHGTLVTGVIASGVNDGSGMAGIAPNATIVPLVAMTKDDSGDQVGTSSTLIQAIVAAVDDYNCKIITCSLGTEGDSSYINKAVAYAIKKGAIVIAAAGNDGASTTVATATALNYPASSPGAISVGATDSSMKKASYSQKNDRVDVVAFGGKLHMPSNTSNTAYMYAWGTSFAAPVVTGAVALFVSNHPNLTAAECRSILRASAKDVGELGSGDYMGSGMPDMLAMEDVYSENVYNSTYISPIYNGHIKVFSADSSLTSAVLVAARFKNGIMTDYTLTDLSFSGNLAYTSDTPPTGYTTRYFVIKSLDTMQSLSSVRELKS